jgi:hypothetical protein
MPEPTLIITGAVVVALMASLMYFARRDQPIADPSDGAQIVRYSPSSRAFAIIAAFGIPIGISVWVFVEPPPNRREHIAALELYALFACLSAPMLLQYQGFALLVSPEGLDCRSPWRARQFFPWEEIEQLSYNPFFGLFVVCATSDRAFRVPLLVKPLNAFLDECEQRLSVDQLVGAKRGYNLVGRNFPEK